MNIKNLIVHAIIYLRYKLLSCSKQYDLMQWSIAVSFPFFEWGFEMSACIVLSNKFFQKKQYLVLISLETQRIRDKIVDGGEWLSLTSTQSEFLKLKQKWLTHKQTENI